MVVAVGTTGGPADRRVRGGRYAPSPVLGAVVVVLVAANVLLVLGGVLGLPPAGLLGVVPVLVLDLVAVAVLLALAARGRPPTAGTLLPRRYPVAARAASGLVVAWAVAAVAGDSFVALLAAPAGVFALVMALFRTAAVWWRWCARAAAVCVLTWPVPVLVGVRLDRDAIEGWGVGFGSLVAMLLVGVAVTLAGAAAVGYALAGSGSPADGAREAAAEVR